MKRGHVPVRTCVGCRARRPKAEMIRFVIGCQELALGNARGRGAYVCRAEACLEKALKRKNLANLSGGAPATEALAELRQAVSRGVGPGEQDRRQSSCGASGGGAIG
jgi:predicted RNA-binding protein YlxR (DUF448 family)